MSVCTCMYHATASARVVLFEPLPSFKSNMSFFIRGAASKRKKPFAKKDSSVKPKRDASIAGNNKLRKKRSKLSEVIISDSSEDEVEFPASKRKLESSSSDSEEEETAQEKRLRLTKQYLAQLEEDEKDNEETKEIDRDAISHRLREEVLEQSGKLQRKVAQDYDFQAVPEVTVLRGHKLSITCLVISPDNKHAYSGAKDCSIIKWNLESCCKEYVIPGGKKGTEDTHRGHTTHVLALAISSDNSFLASGCRSKVIHIWNPGSGKLLHTFRGHRDAVSGLSFRKGTHTLYSASHDRSVKVWNLDEMAYVETLFGHQDSIMAIDSLSRERAVTAGGRDNSLRVWKIIEESQLIYNSPGGSVDCVKLINEEHFISGSDDGSIALWSVLKKKPVAVVKNAHSKRFDTITNGQSATQGAAIAHEENWISAVAALQSTDLLASGSKDSKVRLWQCSEGYRSLQPLASIDVVGFVNALQFTSDGRLLVAGVGQEHRLGRWWCLKEAKNSIVIVRLRRKTDDGKSEED
ncbi:U3 small nucleolar RNA-interacting protein 2-like isoform X2 [Acanthaster planci]|uniref:U3 small nucleolar RNA-interacting protein 2 n=1 Tax=Acanthaster planci TaxID=133434 RepID=A0A8B7ZGL4_ACAPL|nr:U3 small nucleolar RNA-interacting protein 2-like isoform X2 [Acanthaster planci]